jgi:hypothetical protein
LGLDFFGYFLCQVFHPAPAGAKSDKTWEVSDAQRYEVVKQPNPLKPLMIFSENKLRAVFG